MISGRMHRPPIHTGERGFGHAPVQGDMGPDGGLRNKHHADEVSGGEGVA